MTRIFTSIVDVHGITPKADELSETNPCLLSGPVCRNGDELTVSSRSSGDDRTIDGALNGKSRLHHSHEVIAAVTPRKVQQTPLENGNLVKVNVEKPPEEVQHPLQLGQKIAEASNDQVPESHQDHMLEQDSTSEVSFVRKVWQRWFGGSNDNFEEKGDNLPENYGDSEDSSEKRNKSTLKKYTGVSSEREGMKEQCEEKSCEVPYAATISSSSNDSTVDTKVTGEASKNHTGKRPGLFNWIANWCKFWRSSQDSEVSSDQSCEKLNKIKTNSLKREVFTQGSFWKELEILIDSPRGSLFVTWSRTGFVNSFPLVFTMCLADKNLEEIGENLLKEGPLVLRSLSNTKLLQLVDLLISDKKWIEECPSQTPPFKITRAFEKSPSLGHFHTTNGLRSIFMRKKSQANLQPKHEGEKKLQNIPHSGVSSTIINNKSSDHSRCEILADCQKLVKEILMEHPEGYNMGKFRKQFLERYGYPLDVQRLGYKKLASLLEKMPRIKIESNYIIPASMVPDKYGLETAVPNIRENTSYALRNTACELPNASTKGDDFDSTGDELGPVSITSSNRKELQSVLGSKRKEDTKITYPYYEPSLSDDEISNFEGEISSSEQSGLQQKQGIDEEDSSLLQILDSWYSIKEGKDRKDNSENSEAMVDYSEYNVKPSGAARVGMKTKNSLDYGKRQRLQKNYSFVANSVGRDKDKLINGILGSLRKSSESRIKA
ncbi:hypothetical protein CRYUN_Cryun17cG0079800 [Craigia yunnanensis]